MQYQVLKEPMAILDIQMSSGQKIAAKSGAMVYMKGDMEIKTRTREGGFFKKVKVTALGGKSFFVNDYIAHGDCSIGLTGPPLGDIVRLDVKQESGFIVQSGLYVASTQGILLDTPLTLSGRALRKDCLAASFLCSRPRVRAIYF